MGPSVSVLLPVRNGLPWLPAALDSVLVDPTLDPGEIVAVDDGSTDGSGAWLDERARREPRLRVLRSGARGIAAALNLALRAARGPLIARMDADDLSVRGRIGRLRHLLLDRPRVAVAGTGVALHPEGARGGGMQRYVEWLNSVESGTLGRELWRESPLAHPTLGARLEAILDVGGYREGGFPEDYDLLLRLYARGWKLARVPEVLYLWRDHQRRLTRSDPRYAETAIDRLKLSHLAVRLGGPRPILLWGAGRTGRRLYRALRELGFSVRAWIDVDPRKIGRDLHGAPVLGPAALGRIDAAPLLVAVSAPGASDAIRLELLRQGLVELEDYFVLA